MTQDTSEVAIENEQNTITLWYGDLAGETNLPHRVLLYCPNYLQ